MESINLNVRFVFLSISLIVCLNSNSYANEVFSNQSLSPETKTSTYSLPALNAISNATSISGISSGAFMASQFHVAYSNDLVGVGIVAGGPWNCAASNPLFPAIVNATTTCMNPCKAGICGPFPDSKFLSAIAEMDAKKGNIDPIDNLKNDNVYIFSGSQDKTVITKVVDTTFDFYKKLKVKNIEYINNLDAGHAFITNNPEDTECNKTADPYINYCNMSQARDILKHIYKGLKSPAIKISGELIKFNQHEFLTKDQINRSSMDDNAFVYIPKSCTTNQCRVHVALHGCAQGVSVIGTEFITDTGYLEIADTNKIIVLFPQVKSSNLNPMNPNGCWDFWGYSTYNLSIYHKKSAPQMEAIKKMIDRLIS
ncbi:poly(3-hydroxybutyrate) depolymerase [Photobacterium piscicola]|uniref:extracellular catalytic domain type 2 short-chain-length polyhydroxyalkanoate depolymerase n=1 Tax=Photobacterium piscicola TaxID=1378299 RepID=UPI0038D074A0